MPIDEATYAEIKERDVGAIGKHCDVSTCHRLDFLPFKCGSCQGTYCLDHRSETAHSCKHEGKWATERRQRELGKSASPSPTPITEAGKGQPLVAEGSVCAHPRCKTVVNTARTAGVFCSTCRRTYCLPHRLQDSHDCASLKPLHAPGSAGAKALNQTQAAGEKAKAALARFKAWTTSKSESVGEKVKEKRKGNQVVELMRLKREAKGDEKVAMDKRIYVYVEAEKASTQSKLPKGEFFYSKDWSVGKVLDQAAASLQIQNVNNRGDDEETRLRVFHVEGGRMLTFGEKFGDAVASGNTIVLLRGVMLPDLMAEV
ncbi:hypothetical protein BDZ91DRAFT_697893 [Kalaharituber pfeilii]|nr:hypothetical protein BDZ91DRAFT_697893 [Kalaharituber pfeilii]